jgi:hypothetical protein
MQAANQLHTRPEPSTTSRFWVKEVISIQDQFIVVLLLIAIILRSRQ